MGLSHLKRISIDDLIQYGGLTAQEAIIFLTTLDQALQNPPQESHLLWQQISKTVLHPDQPFDLHRLIFKACYTSNNSNNNQNNNTTPPPFYWMPCLGTILSTNYAQFLSFQEIQSSPEWQSLQTGDLQTDWNRLHTLSIKYPEIFWSVVLNKALRMHFHGDLPQRIIGYNSSGNGGYNNRFANTNTNYNNTNHNNNTTNKNNPDTTIQWLPNAHFNIAECALRWRDGDLPAIIWAHEDTPHTINTITRRTLAQRAQHIADSLHAWGIPPGSNIAIDMPMNAESVIAYLGIILAGCAAVSIAESFSSKEIEVRLRIARCAAIFTQDVVPRGGKNLPLYDRVVKANAPRAIVLLLCDSSSGNSSRVVLRDQDISWDNFLTLSTTTTNTTNTNTNNTLLRPHATTTSNDLSGVLFSSGTTGEPKAICWTHVTPLRCATDAYFHQDVHERDVVCWPTSMGWMMGPWLVYASLMNGAAMALFLGNPLDRGFGQFVSAARVTVLGVVPSIVRAWRSTDCMKGVDFSSIKLFASTGEASAEDDVLWLSSRAGYRPVIEYCGGTELGGAYMTGSLVQPQAASTFSTPTFGTDVVILSSSDDHNTNKIGEMAVRMPMLGASQRLLNADHYKVYYEGMPEPMLRRHGDELEALAGNYYKAHGRVDDTMNLGGVKVSSVELESAIVDGVDGVVEVAAVAVPPVGGGPDVLVVFLVEKDGKKGDVMLLKEACQRAISGRLNPLFKVDRVVVVEKLPRTATNKVMRRLLRGSVVGDNARRARM